MQDSTPFRWLEERGPACQLIAVIDDATSRFYARFTEHDTTDENLRTFGEWLRRYGRPLAHYTDKTASSGRLLQRRWGNSCGEKKPARISDEHSGSWGSNGLRPTVRRRKDGSSDCSKRCRIAW